MKDKDYEYLSSNWNPPYGTSPLELVHDFLDGNVLAFVRYESSLIYDHETTETKRGVELYKKVLQL